MASSREELFFRKLGGTLGIGSDIPGHTLDSIVKTELLKDASAEEVSRVWNEYHQQKEGFVCGVIPSMHYAEIEAKSKTCPRFVYAIPKDSGGFEMMYSEFHQHRVSFTTLEAFKALQGSAPPLLELFHYVDYQQTKEIVLMRGVYKAPLTSAATSLGVVPKTSTQIQSEPDLVTPSGERVLSTNSGCPLKEAVFLANQLQMYYRIDQERYKLVRTFNHNPMFFDFNELLKNLDSPDVKIPAHKQSTSTSSE
eukprot:sb/3468714/